jgi:hypothetical protein
MSETPLPGIFTRFFLAWAAYFRTLFDARFAAGVMRLRQGEPALPGAAASEAPAKSSEASSKPSEVSSKPSEASRKDTAAEKKKEVILREAGPEAALQLLALLQREGRFVDFLEEDVSGFADAQIGAAARVVHDGCRKAIREHFPLEPVRAEEEGSKVRIEKGFDAHAVRLTGNVTGEAPFTGTLAHRGWRVKEVKLPRMTEGHDATVVAPAEVEV